MAHPPFSGRPTRVIGWAVFFEEFTWDVRTKELRTTRTQTSAEWTQINVFLEGLGIRLCWGWGDRRIGSRFF